MTRKKVVEITIPVYNEEKELEQSIIKLHKFCSKHLLGYDWQITIANNASTDNTEQIAHEVAKRLPHVRTIHIKRKGRGLAIKTVWRSVKADYYIYMDVDLSTDLIHIPALLHALENNADLAIGSRLKKGATVEGRTVLREVTSRTLNFLFIHLFFKTHFTDAQCGFKAVKKEIVKNLIPHIVDDGWFFDGELLIVAEKMGYTIAEVPVHWTDNPGSTVRLVSTIWGDIKVLWRLYTTKPWKAKKENKAVDY